MLTRNTYDLPAFDWDPTRALIEMSEISKLFKTTAGEVQVLKQVSVDFYRSQFVSVVGRSGSGKSTLVNMLTGIDHPTKGEVRVADRMIHHLHENDMAVWRGRNLGIVFQFFQLLPTLSLLENVMLPMDFCGLYPPAERETRAMKLLEQVGMEKFAHKMPGAVAGGQQQSVAVARALANDPPILIADEPTGNLDARTAEQIMQLFELQVELGKTVIVVTHDRDLARRAQRILVIVDGELVNEALAQAFPDMPHRDLLALTRAAHLETYSTAAVIEPFADGKERLCVVHSGEVQVRHNGGWGHKDKLLTTFTPGEWFTHDRIRSLGSVTLRVGDSGAQLIEMQVEGVKMPAHPRRQA